jgi:hypothetical protein
MRQREIRRRAIRQHHLLHEGFDVDLEIATAKPRSRRSRTVSKYFSIASPRPVKTQTVPLRPAGGAQRAKRNSAPSGVLMVPLTTSSGTGLAGIETSVMDREPAR